MTDAHAQRSKGWAGLAFVLLAIAGAILMWNIPAANAAPAAVTLYLTAHRGALLIAAWIGFPMGAFFLWFVVGLFSYLKKAAGVDEGLPLFALAGGIAAVAVAWSAAGLSAALVFNPVPPAGISFLWGLTALLHMTIGAMPLAVFIFAVAHSMRRHGSAPQWLVWLGYLAAAGQAIMTFGMFYETAMATNHPVFGLFFGAFLFLLWTVAVSSTLIAEGGEELAASGG